jgi:hypothetical protein
MARPVKPQSTEERPGFLGTIRSKWKEQLAFYVLAGIFVTAQGWSGQAFNWMGAQVTAFPCTTGLSRCNLTDADALRLSREVPSIGPAAIDAIPFRNANSGEQYIAVALRDPRDPPESPWRFTVRLLHKAGDEYLDDGVSIGGFDQFLTTARLGRIRQDYGVADIDHDGFMEVYVARSSIGNALQTYWLTVLDLHRHKRYAASADDNLNVGRPTANIPGNVPLPIQAWMVQKFYAMAGVSQSATPSTPFANALQEWIDDNGYGAVDRLQKTGDKIILRLKYHHGTPSTPWSHEVLHVGTLDWEFFFKGPVVQYDRQRDMFVVVVESQSGAWYGVRSAIEGKHFLWMQEETLPRILVYDQQTQVVEAIRYRAVRNPMALLHIRDGNLYVGGERIGIPADIKIHDEFTKTKSVRAFP